MEEQKKNSVVFEAKVEKIDDGEDEEVDKFISLVRKFREARNRRMNELNELSTTTATTNNDTRKRRASSNCKQKCSGWTPKFEMQDFNISQVSVPASNCNSKQRIEVKESSKEENEGKGSEVDLRLAL